MDAYLSSIVKHKYLPMLKRRHGAGVHVQIGICREAIRADAMHAQIKDSPILIEVTRKPQFLSKTPMELAVTPLPRPLTTPPVTSTYFILDGSMRIRGQEGQIQNQCGLRGSESTLMKVSFTKRAVLLRG